MHNDSGKNKGCRSSSKNEHTEVFVFGNIEVIMTFRRKRSDTNIGSIEKQHGVDLGVRSDMKLGKFLKDNGFDSLSKALEEAKKSPRKKR